MEITLVDILQEIKSLRIEMNQRFAEQEEKMDKKMEQRFKEQEEKIAKTFEEQRKMFIKYIREQIDTSTKEIAQELREIIAYFEKKERKQLKKNRQIEEEIENNKVSHKAYDARLYKIELSQSNLESRVLELNNN